MLAIIFASLGLCIHIFVGPMDTHASNQLETVLQTSELVICAISMYTYRGEIGSVADFGSSTSGGAAGPADIIMVILVVLPLSCLVLQMASRIMRTQHVLDVVTSTDVVISQG